EEENEEVEEEVVKNETKMVDRRRMKKKWKSDLFLCHNPFESFALGKRIHDTIVQDITIV
ncbi:hypothetical protein Tco_1130058, partial [Tanacetum coccineum]